VQKGLARIGAVTGVDGCFVCDSAGEVIESSNPAPLATGTMNAIGRQVLQSQLALESAGYAVSRLEFVFDSWRLLARDLGGGQLFVLCDPRADVAIVRLTADIVIAGWKTDKNVMKQLAPRARRDLLKRENMDEVSWRLLNQGT
jgi:hypothetical protein